MACQGVTGCNVDVTVLTGPLPHHGVQLVGAQLAALLAVEGGASQQVLVVWPQPPYWSVSLSTCGSARHHLHLREPPWYDTRHTQHLPAPLSANSSAWDSLTSCKEPNLKLESLGPQAWPTAFRRQERCAERQPSSRHLLCLSTRMLHSPPHQTRPWPTRPPYHLTQHFTTTLRNTSQVESCSYPCINLTHLDAAWVHPLVALSLKLQWSLLVSFLWFGQMITLVPLLFLLVAHQAIKHSLIMTTKLQSVCSQKVQFMPHTTIFSIIFQLLYFWINYIGINSNFSSFCPIQTNYICSLAKQLQ